MIGFELWLVWHYFRLNNSTFFVMSRLSTCQSLEILPQILKFPRIDRVFLAVPLSLENKTDWDCHEFFLLLFSSYFTSIFNPWVFQNVEFAIPHYLNGGRGPIDKRPAEEQCPNSYNDPDIEGPWFPLTYFLTGEFLSKKLCYCGLDSLECGTVPRESHCALGTSYRALHEAQNQKYYCIDEEAEGTTVEQQHRSVTTCTAHSATTTFIQKCLTLVSNLTWAW